MRLTRSTHVVAALAAISLTMAACTAASEPGTADGSTGIKGATGEAVTSDETYKLGLALPFTGSAASYGEEYRMATEIGIEDANKKFAADGITIELVTADTQATAEGGVSAFNKLGAVEKTPAVLTAWSAVVAAGTSVAEDLGFAMFNSGSQTPALIGSSPNLVNVLPMNDAQLENLATYLVEEKGYKNFASIYVDNDTGQGTETAFKAAVEKLGGTMVARESIRQDATDATTQVAKVKASGADFLYLQTLIVDGAAVLKAVKKTDGWDIPMGAFPGIGESRIIREAGGEAMNGSIYMSHMPKDLDGVSSIMDRLQAMDPDRELANHSYNAYFAGVPFTYAEVIKELRAQGAPVTGENVLAVLNTKTDITVPIVGAMDLTDQLTYRGPTAIKRIDDFGADPLDDPFIEQKK